ncbi:MAG: helix-turn-helix transcriptional regulator [Clostridia bacterium]|nr:helix-turn-helix transcriptional regulator [Clostridia bacterium]
MEFHEKLQKLRKDRGLTQEELAAALFVSRTAVSKWESGRGYPGIDSLKEISKFFSVSIDELLSGEKLISIAENENRKNIQRTCGLMIGTADLLSLLMIFLPLYPMAVGGYVYSVNLFGHSEAVFGGTVHWVLFLLLAAAGAVKIILTLLKSEKGQKAATYCSLTLSILAVLFLAMTREAYAAALVFILLLVKAVLLFKYIKAERR